MPEMLSITGGIESHNAGETHSAGRGSSFFVSPGPPPLINVVSGGCGMPASLSYAYNNADDTTTEWMNLALNSGAYDFWKRPEEDVYTENDGEQI
jgi:hypothetical protein